MMIWELGQDNFSGSGPNMLDSLVAYIKEDTTPISSTFLSSTLNTSVKFENKRILLNLPFSGDFILNIRNLRGRTLYRAKKKLSNGESSLPTTGLFDSKGLFIISITDIDRKSNISSKILFQ